MKWVYILQCEDNYFYVGETSRLYRRFWEHQSGLGGLNTSNYPPINIVSIYPVNRLGKFFDYTQKVKNNDYNLKTQSQEVFKKYTGIFAISYNGIIGWDVYEKGGINTERLVEFVNKNINKLQNKLIILDNASSHRSPLLRN